MSDIIPPIVLDGFEEIADMPSGVPTDDYFGEMAALSRFLASTGEFSYAIIVTNCADVTLGDTKGKYVFRPTGAPGAADGITGYGIYNHKFTLETAQKLDSMLDRSYRREFFYVGSTTSDTTNDEILAFIAVLKPARAVVPYRSTARSADPVIRGLSGVSEDGWWFHRGMIWLTPFTNMMMLEIGPDRRVIYCGSYEWFIKHINALSWYRKNAHASNVKYGCNCFNCGMVEVLNDKYNLTLRSPHMPIVPPQPSSEHMSTKLEQYTNGSLDWSEQDDSEAPCALSDVDDLTEEEPSGAQPDKFGAFVAEIAEHAKDCHDPKRYNECVKIVLDGRIKKTPVTMGEIEKIFGDNLIPYAHKKTMYKSQMHLGQVKLIMNEIQFLTKTAAKWCVYAGAAPSNKGAFLAHMFPGIKFLLVDPAPFRVKPYGTVSIGVVGPAAAAAEIADQFCTTDKQILTYNGLFTLELARVLNYKLGDGAIAFISDIRTSPTKTEDDDDESGPTDADIIVNNALQTAWVHVLRPESSMLKFRHPFYSDADYMGDIARRGFSNVIAEAEKATGIAFLENAKNKKTVMHTGEYFLQPYARVSSCEVRLYIKGVPALEQHYVPERHDAVMYTVNNVLRPYFFHRHTGIKDKHADNKHFDGCYDCNLAHDIMSEYVDKFPTVFNMPAVDVIFEMMKTINYKFISDDYSHGFKYGKVVNSQHYKKGIEVAHAIRAGGSEDKTRLPAKTRHEHKGVSGRGSDRGRGRGRGGDRGNTRGRGGRGTHKH